MCSPFHGCTAQVTINLQIKIEADCKQKNKWMEQGKVYTLHWSLTAPPELAPLLTVEDFWGVLFNLLPVEKP